ncbi:Peptidase family C25 [Flavobacteriaceae bacterium MAR_2010_188]|nr:Peptidase family C25 [Flavobacteriaceae bacterium MAR_2010_188]
MKRRLLALIFTLLFNFFFAQEKQFQINWSSSVEMATTYAKFTLPGFDRQNYNFSDDKGLFFYSEWSLDQKINEKSIKLLNPRYESITASELKDLPQNLIPKDHNIKLSNSIDRGKISAVLELAPIIKDNGGFKKLVSFAISYTIASRANRMRSAFSRQEIINSSLADGSFYRFIVEETGVYKISKGFLREIGIDVNKVNPQNIGVFGNGGAMLPYSNSIDAPIDLTENAIEFVGEEDSKLDDSDYILFYAEGPEGYNSESNTNLNLYTDKTYYYIKVGSKPAKRIQNFIEPTSEATLQVNTFQDYQFHEVDEYNLVKLGRRWLGDRFDVDNVKEFKFEFPNVSLTEPAIVKVYAAAVSDVQTDMSVSLNGTDIANFRFQPANEPVLASGGTYIGQQTLNSDQLNFQLRYNNNGNPSSLGYLDYISVEATRALTFEGEQMIFQSKNVVNTSGVVQYNLTQASNVFEVWNISDQFNVSSITNSGVQANFTFKDYAGRAQKYIAISSNGFLTPESDRNSTVANQNLKGTIFNGEAGEFRDIDYLIITPKFLVSQSERLAEINRKEYGLNVKVVSLDDIYLEFSSGSQDISAIRNFIRYVYWNASSPENRVKYVCLFGDSSYDYKDRIPNNSNIVPSWHAYNSFSLTSSFISDDFYGMMDDNEGELDNSDKLDIALGRMLVDNLDLARDMVTKIEQYYAPEAYGSWRNNYIVISDDVDLPYEEVLQKTTNDIGNEVTDNKPYINVVKIHSDSFEQESSSSGERYPAVNKEIKDAIEVGAIAVNYFGHGGEDGLAAERIFDKIDAQEITNLCKYNCFITVTCEYTRFDNPQRPTAGEYIYWNKKGGAVSLLTTTRQIFVTVGTAFNVIMEKYLFSYNTDEELSIAEALRQTKNDAGIAGLSQKRLVFCIGDPAMKLAIPEPNIRLTQINGNASASQGNVLKALDKVKLSGEVTDGSGSILSNFNGTLTATIFDKEISRTTLANDGTRDNNGNIIKLDFKTLGEIIFKGQASVENGLFSFEFVVPRDIGVPVGTGKASFYAKRTNELEDRTGANLSIQIGGINENAEEDNIGPVVNLYMNDENFVSGGITNEAPTLVAKLTDEHGINTASGIGHDILAILDGDETNPFILNEYYKANVDDYTTGTLSYPFRDLEPGIHTLTIKAWDVYNNSSITEIQFIVYDEDEQLVIENVLNYPNPFVDYTEFWFNHNSSDVLDVSIQIFTVSGKLVRTLNGQTSGDGKTSTSSLSKDIVWDGRDDFGDRIGKGVYIYKLKVRSSQLNRQVEKIQKLVIL